MAFCYYAEVKHDDNGELFIERTINPELAPVVHAHWVDNGEPYCSRCEWSPAPEWPCIEDLQLADVYYCPHCGAKMDGKDG